MYRHPTSHFVRKSDNVLFTSTDMNGVQTEIKSESGETDTIHWSKDTDFVSLFKGFEYTIVNGIKP